MSIPLGLAELITRVGDANVVVEPVHDNLQGAQLRRGGLTELRLLTNQTNPNEIIAGEWPKLGLLVWIPRDLAEAARRAHEEEAAKATS